MQSTVESIIVSSTIVWLALIVSYARKTQGGSLSTLMQHSTVVVSCHSWVELVMVASIMGIPPNDSDQELDSRPLRQRKTEVRRLNRAPTMIKATNGEQSQKKGCG